MRVDLGEWGGRQLARIILALALGSTSIALGGCASPVLVPVKSDWAENFYTVKWKTWRALGPTDAARGLKLVKSNSYPPLSIPGESKVTLGEYYAFIPVCRGNAVWDQTQLKYITKDTTVTLIC
jgi:hypothetical protein